MSPHPKKEEEKPPQTDEKVCGVIMPISSIDGCSEAHWTDVKSIIFDVVEKAGFMPNLVSNADDVGIIQKRIIQNLYENPIAVCDVSGKNPNVMFELGIRLAFDKPTIIVKDDKTSYSFDTAPIEHLGYPRDLRYGTIADFKENLSLKILATYKASSDPEYTTFLKHFGTFTVAKLETKEAPIQAIMLEEFKTLKDTVLRHLTSKERNPQDTDEGKIVFPFVFSNRDDAREFSAIANSVCRDANPAIVRGPDDHWTVRVGYATISELQRIDKIFQRMLSERNPANVKSAAP